MRRAILVLLIGLTAPAPSWAGVAERLLGHWTADRDLTSLHPGYEETGWVVTLRRARYTPVSYEWGGPAAGFRFDANRRFVEYENVMCSTDSDPVRFQDERWRLQDRGRTLVISGSRREVRFTIVAVDRRRLKLRVVDVRAVDGSD